MQVLNEINHKCLSVDLLFPYLQYVLKPRYKTKHKWMVYTLAWINVNISTNLDIFRHTFVCFFLAAQFETL